MGIEEQIDKLIDLGEDIKSRLDLLFELASDHFAGANKMVADEPAKEPEPVHPAGPMPDPGEGYRILSKNPPEELQEGDEFWFQSKWHRSAWGRAYTEAQEKNLWYRRKIEVAKEPEPAWEPKVGDWVRVTRPSDWNGWVAPLWQVDMNRFDGRVGQIENQLPYGFTIRGFYGKCGFLLRWHRDWLTPADEPAKEPEPEHPAGPKPNPGEGYRLLSKEPLEELQPGDQIYSEGLGVWEESIKALAPRQRREPQSFRLWYRRKIEQPEPAWEPKVGDWVRVTRPVDWKEWKDPLWREEMHIYDGKVFKIVKWSQSSAGRRATLQGIDWFFHRDWLSPAEPPEPEYREPVLPGDLGKLAEFSQDGINWIRYKLCGCYKEPESSLTIWSEKNIGFRHCRIKKDT